MKIPKIWENTEKNCSLRSTLEAFGTAVPLSGHKPLKKLGICGLILLRMQFRFEGQNTTQIPRNLSPKRDCIMNSTQREKRVHDDDKLRQRISHTKESRPGCCGVDKCPNCTGRRRVTHDDILLLSFCSSLLHALKVSKAAHLGQKIADFHPMIADFHLMIYYCGYFRADR